MKLTGVGETLEIGIWAGASLGVEDQGLCSGVFVCRDLAVASLTLLTGQVNACCGACSDATTVRKTSST
jgi:hypothetical protein